MPPKPRKPRHKSKPKSSTDEQTPESAIGGESIPESTIVPLKKSNGIEKDPFYGAVLQPPWRHKDPKKAYGQSGRPIRLYTNFFEVKINQKNIDMTHYDVTILNYERKDIRLPRKKKLAIFSTFQKQYFRLFNNIPLAFDSEKNAYSVGRIKQFDMPQTYEVEYKEDGEEMKEKFYIKIKTVNSANLVELYNSINTKQITQKSNQVPTVLFQMLDVMFRYYKSLQFVQVGKNRFFPMNELFMRNSDLGSGKESILGIFTSLRPAAWKDGSLLLNVDVAHAAFYKDVPVIEFLKENLRLYENDFKRVFQPQVLRKVNKALSRMKLYVTHTPIKRTYNFNAIAPVSARRHTFKADGKNVTVEEYFKSAYNKQLRYPDLNCVHVGAKKKEIYIPMEFLCIAKGQRADGKLSDRETAAFIKTTAVEPHQRRVRIQDIHRKCDMNKDPLIQTLGFTIEDMPLCVDGRVLPPPKLEMCKKQFEPVDGVWDIRGKGFHMSANLERWVVLNYDGRTREEQIWRFIKSLQNIGRERGMNIADPHYIYESHDPPDKDFGFIKNDKEKPNIQLVLCVIPKSKIYSEIKSAGDVKFQIISQCVLSMNVDKNNSQTVGNILMKINAKLGGVNNIIAPPNSQIVQGEPTLVMGADVNHPPAGDLSTPSIAAVVASCDLFASKYAVSIKVQKHRTEYIQDLESITRDLLKSFYKYTHQKPRRIIMFRDGVSESQFVDVLKVELTAMRIACTKLDASYKPAMTFLCVQKRHHTRLFCDERDGVGRSRNIPPGTTVDRDICHPFERDFYLCSHQGIQGTSKPTHYHVLWDDSDFDMTFLQALTYSMCHLYSRCARSVSIPTPAYYAHLAAFRAKTHIQNLCGEDSSSTVGSECSLSDLVSATDITGVSDRMYFV